MATYYVSTTGSNSNNGLSQSAPWLTVAYALGATSGFASGDTLWIKPGVYRETVTVGITNPTAATYIKGDLTALSLVVLVKFALQDLLVVTMQLVQPATQ